MNMEMIEKLQKSEKEEVRNLMLEYTNLAQKYNKLMSEITKLIEGKIFSDDVLTYDIQEAIKRSIL